MKQLRGGVQASSRESVFVGLKACLESRDLGATRDLYSLVIKTGLDSICIVGDHLIRLFSSCSSLPEALYVFSRVHQPSLYTWNSIISAHIQLDHPRGAVSLHGSMSIPSDHVTLSCVLKAAISTRDIHTGKHAHTQIALLGIPVDLVLGGTLVHFYAKLGTLKEASLVFNCLPCRDVVSWCALMEGFLDNGQSYNALDCLRRMQQQGIPLNHVALLLGLRVCSTSSVVEHGMPLHANVFKLGYEKDTRLQSALVEMYSKHGFLEEVESTFKSADGMDLVLWSSILGAYVRSCKYQSVLRVYERMVASGMSPDKVVFLFLLQTCGNIGSLVEGYRVHKDITLRGHDKSIEVENALTNMYNQCGDLWQAYQLFDRMRVRDEISWTIIITGHVNCGQYIRGLMFFGNMQLEGLLPNASIISSILVACGNLSALEEGHIIHEYVIQSNLDKDFHINNALVYMYGSLGRLRDSQDIFKEIVEKDISSWGSMMVAFAEHGQVHSVLNILEEMQREGLLPDKGILICSLSTCGLLGAVEEGNWICHLAFNHAVDLDARLLCEMVCMYAGCGKLEDAEAIFDRVAEPDVAMWSVLIAGYCEHRRVSSAVRCVGQMLKAGVELDHVSYFSLLQLCCELRSLEEGKFLYSQIVQAGFDNILCIQCSVIDIYMKCMSIDDAHYLLRKVEKQDSVMWKSMSSHLGLVTNNQVHDWFEKTEEEFSKSAWGTWANIFGASRYISFVTDRYLHFQHTGGRRCTTQSQAQYMHC